VADEDKAVHDGQGGERDPAAGGLPAGLAELVPAYLGRQRWYAGRRELGPGDVEIVETRELCSTAGGRHRLHWIIVGADGDRYQLLVGERPDGEPAPFLNGNESAFLGVNGESYFYDAVTDAELALQLLPVVTAGVEYAERVRPISAEQSNTSLVFDDRIIVKFFRRLLHGPNPDVETTTALAGAGFEHVARPIARWRQSEVDFAFAQDFLAGGTDGWALAQTSLRDFYNSDADLPGEAGGDFSGESRRLGRVTAELHAAMAEVWGVDRDRLAAGEWVQLVDDIERRLDASAALIGEATGEGLGASARTAVGSLRAVVDPGPASRVHGDYHLGQVMRTDRGWYILDFEGEPARPLDQRMRPASPLKDVTGLLRSLDYAARFALGEATGGEVGPAERAAAWERHNGAAFLDGYLAVEGVGALLPTGSERELVLGAYELDKALYELDYESAYRPAWMPIPAGAIVRILSRLAS
jgi:maltokinase